MRDRLVFEFVVTVHHILVTRYHRMKTKDGLPGFNLHDTAIKTSLDESKRGEPRFNLHYNDPPRPHRVFDNALIRLVEPDCSGTGCS